MAVKRVGVLQEVAMIGAVSGTPGGRQESIYYGDGQRVWPLRRLTCTNVKLPSLHLIAPVITGRYESI
jgi:hypothetical protein